jgi:hypothetical protein
VVEVSSSVQILVYRPPAQDHAGLETLAKIASSMEEEIQVENIMMKLQVQSERRGPLPRSCEVVCSNTGN